MLFTFENCYGVQIGEYNEIKSFNLAAIFKPGCLTQVMWSSDNVYYTERQAEVLQYTYMFWMLQI